jgi:hypothetical protein
MFRPFRCTATSWKKYRKPEGFYLFETKSVAQFRLNQLSDASIFVASTRRSPGKEILSK